MVAMPVTLQTGENEGRCLETYIKHTEISHVLCICTCMSTCMLDINMYVYNVSYIDKDTCLYNVCKNVSFQSYNSFSLDSVKPTEVLYVIGVKGAKRKNKNFMSLYQRNGTMALLL